MNIKSTLFFIVKLMLAAGIIYFLCRHQNTDDFMRIFQIPFWILLLIFVLFFAQQAVASWRWKQLLHIQNIEVSFYTAFILTLQSIFCSLIIPAGAIGGDLVKTTMICKHMGKGARIEPAMSIFIDRVIGMLALFLMIIILSPFMLFALPNVGIETQLIITILIPVCSAGVLAGVALFKHRFLESWKLTAPLFRWIHRIGGNGFERILISFDLYKNATPKLLLYILISMFFIHLPMSIIIYLLIYGLGFSGALLAIIFAGLAANVASVIPLSLGGFGFREATLFFILMDFASIPESGCKTIILLFAICILSMTLLMGTTLFLSNRLDQYN